MGDRAVAVEKAVEEDERRVECREARRRRPRRRRRARGPRPALRRSAARRGGEDAGGERREEELREADGLTGPGPGRACRGEEVRVDRPLVGDVPRARRRPTPPAVPNLACHENQGRYAGSSSQFPRGDPRRRGDGGVLVRLHPEVPVREGRRLPLAPTRREPDAEDDGGGEERGDEEEARRDTDGPAQ